MTPEQITRSDTLQLVGTYREAAKLHGEASERGDHKVADESAKLIAAIYAEIRDRGFSVQHELLPMLHDPDPGIRLWSAAHTLEFSSKDGEAALELLSARGSLTGFSAKMTLEQWRTGKLRFP